MARVAGVDLPRDKRIDVALTYIFGIGQATADQVVEIAKVNPATRVRDLTEEEATRLRDVIERNFKVEGNLRREIAANIRRLIEISCYRGIRHRRGLPVRGQRTKTNSRTRKGPKRGIGIRKK